VGGLNAAINDAFDAEIGSGKSEETTTTVEQPEVTPEPQADEKSDQQAATPQEDEPTGDVLLDKLTPDQIAELKKDPRLKAIYKGLMSSYTPRMQQLSEAEKMYQALTNDSTRRQAVEALARATGIELKPTDEPQRQQAAEVADSISEDWSKVVGPEAAAMLRPLIEKTALAAVNGTLQPLQQATQYLQMDARSRQAEAQTSQFKALASEKGWTLTPEVESKMAMLGQQFRPAKAIESVSEGVEYLSGLYRLATADTNDSAAERRVLDRMKKAAQTAEPTRSVPSVGRKESSIPRGTSLNDALEIAVAQALEGK